MTTTLEAPVAAPARRRIPVWLAIIAASLPMFMATLDNLVVSTAIISHRKQRFVRTTPALVNPARRIERLRHSDSVTPDRTLGRLVSRVKTR